MDQEDLVIGDVVALKSDPDQRMTVCYTNETIVKCVWFNGGFPTTYDFKRVCLARIS